MSVVQEALVRLMKQEYNAAGYTVAMTKNGVWINLAGEGWSVWQRVKGVPWKTLPRKTLALIVEHLGELPEPGSCCRIRKNSMMSRRMYECVTELSGS